MNNQGGSNDNIHLGDTQIFGNLTVSESFTVEGGFEVVGDLIIDPPACLKTDCVKPVTASAAVEIKNSSDDTVAIFNDDQSIGAFSIYGNSGGLLLASDSAGQAVAQLNQGLGLSTAGLRLINTKLNVDEIQSQSHEVSGSNPKILFTASKVEITGDTATEFETKTILTSDIKKDDTGGNLTIKAADGTQILRTDDNLKEVYIGEDADGYRMPKLRDTIGHILTMSNTGVATFEEPAQTGAHTVIGTIVDPRTVYGFGSYANVAISIAGTTSIAPNTWAIGDVLTVRILGEYTATARTGGTSNFRLVVGALGSVVSSFVNPATNGTVSKQPFELSIGLTRASATTINFVGTGIFQDNDGANKPSKQFDFNSGVITGYNETLALPVDIEYIDNSISGTGTGYVRYVATSGIWTQSTPSSVVPVISTADHTALSNLVLGDAGHTQFALLTGRPGGQTLSGGSSLSSEDLIIKSNSIDPTSGYVKIQSDVIMSDQTIWGSEAPSGFLRLASTSDGIKGQILMLDEVLASDKVNMNGTNITNAAEIQAIGAQALKLFGAPNIELYGSSSPGFGTIELKTNTTSVYDVSTSLAPTTGDNLCNKTYVDGKAAEYLPLVGGTLTGDLTVGGAVGMTVFTEPLFSNQSPWIGNGMTYADRTLTTAVLTGQRYLLSTTSFSTAETATNYKLILKIGVISGPNIKIGVDRFGTPATPPSSGTGIPSIYMASPDSGATWGGAFSLVSGTEVLNIVGSTVISTNDYIEIRVSNSCTVVEFFYHGSSVIQTPTLIFQFTSIPITLDVWRYTIGDSTSASSSFIVDTIPFDSLDVIGNTNMVGNLTVSGSIEGDVGSSWGYWVGNDYATPIDVTVGSTHKMLNNGLGAGGFLTQIPESGWLFWNTSTSLIEPEFEGDAYDLELRITAENNNASGYFNMELELGTGGGIITIPLGINLFPKGANTVHNFAKTNLIFCANTFKATGGTLNLISGLGTTKIRAFSCVISRNHRAR